LLICDFEAKHPRLFRIEELAEAGIRMQFPGYRTEGHAANQAPPVVELQRNPIPFSTYEKAFQKVKKQLHYGNSFLTNLTMATPVQLNVPLDDLFDAAQARYKIRYRDEWVCFSPEIFIQIREGFIYSYPMKGTIDAALPNAAQVILNDPKESAEHYTIVDLIRNDLAMVSEQVEVIRFRYLDELKTSGKNLLQVSSEIRGRLPHTYREQLGNLLFRLLPAGSVSGAPKAKTLEIIREAEGQDRGFYTGVAFYFDGETVDSCVLIRFVEKTAEGFVYRSGGGITMNSEVEKEYQELMDKIYVPRL